MIKGIDVSSYQSEAYSLTGMDFVIVKATESTNYVNPKHAAQVKRARDNGRVVGHYHFAHGTDIAAQVDYFVKHAGAEPDEFLALDWETPDMSSAEKDAFLKALKARAGGRKVILYCNQSYATTRDASGYHADGLWVAQYNGKPGHPSISGAWLIHQYTSSPVDTNVANFASRAAMATWAKPKLVPAKLPMIDTSNVHDAFLFYPKRSAVSAVKIVQKALAAEKLYPADEVDGLPGAKTKTAFRKYQVRIGYNGSNVNGIPGKVSLTRLGAAHGFTLTP